MACVNLVFLPQKLNSNDTLQRDTRGFNAAFSHWIPSVSVVQFTVQMSKLNGLGKTHRERIFVVELKLKLRSPFHYEQIVWENSDIEWMKVPSISSTVTKYLTFELPRYFLWTIKMNCRRSLVHFSTNVMTLMLKQIHSETNIFLSTKVIWEREKRGLISYLSAWGSDRRLCLKILPSRKNKIYLWQMGTKVVWGCPRRLTKALPLPVGRDRKMLTG